MYNGIGLQTARGSGTNGYVQTNRFLVKPRVSKVLTDSSLKGFASGEGTAGLSKKANREILEHDRKRRVELKLLLLEEKLTDQGFTDKEVTERLEEARRGFEREGEAEGLEDGEVGTNLGYDSKISDTQTHQIAARKERQMETLRAALGIGTETKSQNKLSTTLESDSEDMNDEGEGEPANGHKIKKNGKGNVHDTSDLKNIKKSHGDESGEDDTFNKSARHKKQGSGRGRRGDSSDSDVIVEKVVKKAQKKSRAKTATSESDDTDADAKRKKKPSQKSRSSRRRHDSDSSDSESDTDSSSDSGSDVGREHERSLKKRDHREDSGSKYHKRDVKEAKKKQRKSSSSSDSDQSDVAKKNLPRKSGRSRRHKSYSSSSESESDSMTYSKSSSDSGSGRRTKKPLKKHQVREDYGSDKILGKSKTRHDSDDESDQEDRGLSSQRERKEEQSTFRAEKVDIDLDDRKGKRGGEDRGRYKSRSFEPEKIQGRTREQNDTRKHESSRYVTDSSSDSDGHGKSGLEVKAPKDSHRRLDGDLNDSRRLRKEHAHGDNDKSRLQRDVDGLDTLRKLEKHYQSKEEKRVDSDRVGIETNRSKRNTGGGNWEEQPVRKSRRQDTSDSEYNYELKHSHGSQVRTENPITDRWGSDSARDHDVVKRGSGENSERQGRKHGRDEEEDDKDRERQQPERSRREQDDRRGSKYDRDGDRDSTKRARYDDARDEEEDDKDRERQQPERSRREQDDRRGSKYDRDGDRDSTKRARYDEARDEEEDDKDRERQQPERNRREQDDRRGSKYDRDGDRDSTKRARYDDSRSAGRTYDEDEDRHGRRYSDGRHDDRRPRR